MASAARIASLSTCLVVLVHGQVNANETIWSSVILTRYGDRTPLISQDQSVLTPLGAQQLYSSGAMFRQRYIAPSDDNVGSDHVIDGISTYEIDSTQVFTMSTADQFVVASAQAFIQGLYPPLNLSSSHPVLNDMSILANGSNIDFPLGGYQYPQIYTTSPVDPNSIWIAGDVNCPIYDSTASLYFSTSQYQQLANETQAFYNKFQDEIFSGELPSANIDYHNAYYVFDYLNYGFTHNRTVKNLVAATDLDQARTLADQWEFAINGNTTAGRDTGDRIQTVAGQTVAAEILGLFFNNIETGGQSSKLNLLFSSFEPMIAFAALAGLPAEDANFYGLPDYGSSMVFELFSSDSTSKGSFPDPSQLSIRFLFRNGTNASANLDTYPLFGRTDSSLVMNMTDFVSEMENIMIAGVGDWCNACNSGSVFCAAYTNSSSNSSTTGSGTSLSGGTASHSMKPAVAGVIGAVISLVLAAIILAGVMLLGGVRMYRTNAKRRSDLGGFKGGEKLASDQDLTIPKAAAGASVVKGHERIGSWELAQGGVAKDMNPNNDRERPESLRRPSYEGDDDVRPGIQPTQVEERF